MSIDSAEKFIIRAMNDRILRDMINQAEDAEALSYVLKLHSFDFNEYEFDDAYRVVLLKCPNEEAANALKEFKLWWNLSAVV
ncbi:MAG TPA: Nif11-like leader peptide family natural product precursor [Spirochaetota bacterium]|nr:Nif11-like leader peptide family natural product precursor [Spirochaetota bacterium]HQE58150.1 Nif11-like leader peptide family natural product precursor [Spirochaetota bacterium]